MKITEPSVDRFDIALLGRLSESVFEFPRTNAQENRLIRLYNLRLVERRGEVYSSSARRKQIELRNSYRLSARGAKLLRVHREA